MCRSQMFMSTYRTTLLLSLLDCIDVFHALHSAPKRLGVQPSTSGDLYARLIGGVGTSIGPQSGAFIISLTPSIRYQ